jgi:hypothetical protein
VVRPDGSAEIFIDINDIGYNDTLNIEFVKGASRAPIGWTAGDYEPGDGSFTVAKSQFQKGIVKAIGNGWLGSVLSIVVKYNDEGEDLIVDEITCRISGAEDAHSSGPGALNTKVSLKVIKIVRDNIEPIA